MIPADSSNPARVRTVRPWLALAVLCAASAVGVGSASAATITWNGSGNGNWSDGANWDGGTPPGAGDTPTFSDTGAVTTFTSTVDTSTTVAGYAVTATAAPVALTIASGQILTVNGTVNVGLLPPTTTAVTTALTITGDTFSGGTTANAKFIVGVDVGTGATPDTATVDMSGLKNFTFSAGGTSAFNVSAGNRIKGTVTLANTVNTIAVAAINVGTTGTQNTNTGTLNLGADINLLNANAINIGTSKQNGLVQFAGSSGSVIIRGVDDGTGATRAAITVGTRSASGSTATSGSLLLSGHHVDILAGTLTIGSVTNSGATAGTVAFDTGTLDATSVAMGAKTNSGNLTATLTVGSSPSDDATFIVNRTTGGTAGTGTFTMANQTNTSGTFSSLFDIKGGTATIYSDITQTGATAANVKIQLEGGTLDMTGHNIGSATGGITIIASGGTLQNVNSINGAGGLTVADTLATPAGTTLFGTNAYTGPTTVSTGRLTVNGTLSSSPVTVSTGASLAGNGTIGNTVEIAGTLVPGNGPGLVINNTLTFDPGSHLSFNVGSGDGATATSLLAFNFTHAVLGTGNATLDLAGTLDYTKTYTLFRNTTSTPADFQFAAVTGYDSADFAPVFSSSNGNYLLSFAATTAVPEPASLGLLALGAAALLTRRRSR